jgi:hypothetical protein
MIPFEIMLFEDVTRIFPRRFFATSTLVWLKKEGVLIFFTGKLNFSAQGYQCKFSIRIESRTQIKNSNKKSRLRAIATKLKLHNDL